MKHIFLCTLLSLPLSLFSAEHTHKLENKSEEYIRIAYTTSENGKMTTHRTTIQPFGSVSIPAQIFTIDLPHKEETSCFPWSCTNAEPKPHQLRIIANPNTPVTVSALEKQLSKRRKKSSSDSEEEPCIQQ